MGLLETIDTRDLVLLANDMHQQYSEAKEDLYNTAKRYFTQSIGSSYLSEDVLIEKIELCRHLKEEYIEIKAILTDRNVKQDRSGWANTNNFLFRNDEPKILHLA